MLYVRKALPSDCDAIVRFQEEMAWHTEKLILDHQTVLNGVKAVLDNESLGTYYIAEIGNEIAGSLLTTYEWSDWRNGTVIWIQSVYVDSSHRRKGIYKAANKKAPGTGLVPGARGSEKRCPRAGD